MALRELSETIKIEIILLLLFFCEFYKERSQTNIGPWQF